MAANRPMQTDGGVAAAADRQGVGRREDVPMLRLKGQILASTLTDSQGERMTVEDLRTLCPSEGARMPLRSHHDLTTPANGSLENFRVVPHPSEAGEWVIVADVEVENAQDFEEGWGFSFSSTVGLSANHPQPEMALFLPWPLYADKQLVAELLSGPERLRIGKWLKKSADPATVALLASLATIIIQPIWDHAYKAYVYPFIEALKPRIRELFDRGVKTQLALSLEAADGRVTKVILVPEEDQGESLSSLATDLALCEAAEFVRDGLPSPHRHPKIIVMHYDKSSSRYSLLSCEYDDGSLVHIGTR